MMIALRRPFLLCMMCLSWLGAGHTAVLAADADPLAALRTAGAAIAGTEGQRAITIGEQCQIPQDEAATLAARAPGVASVTVTFRAGTPKDPKDLSRALTDKGLAAIAGMASLEELNIESPLLTDEGVTQLANLKQLKRLGLRGQKLSSGWGDGLAGKLPQLEEVRYFALPHVNDRSRWKGRSLGAHCRALSTFPKLATIHADHCLLDGPGLAEISKVTTLKTLHIGGLVNVDKEIGGLTSVEDLYLGINTNITDQNILALASLKKLKRLTVGGITDTGMPVFKDLSQLESLRLVGVVSGDGLESLTNLSNLRVLDCTVVARPNLAVLARLPQLEKLTIGGRLHDSEILPLADSRSLRSIAIGDSQVTPTGLSALQAKLPNTQVRSVGGQVAELGAGLDLNHMRHLTDRYEQIVGEKLLKTR